MKKLAVNTFTDRECSCYGYAAAFAAVCYEIGYTKNNVIVCTRIYVGGGRDHARDGYTRHAYNRIDGRYFDVDGRADHWFRNCFNRKGYPYRKKGTVNVRIKF